MITSVDLQAHEYIGYIRVRRPFGSQKSCG